MYLPNSIESLWEKLDKLCTFKFSLIVAKQLDLQELRILWAAVCWMSTGNVSEETLSSPGLRNFQPEVETHNPVAEVRPKVKLFLLWSPSRFRSGCSCRDRGPRWGHVLRDALKKHTHTQTHKAGVSSTDLQITMWSWWSHHHGNSGVVFGPFLRTTLPLTNLSGDYGSPGHISQVHRPQKPLIADQQWN